MGEVGGGDKSADRDFAGFLNGVDELDWRSFGGEESGAKDREGAGRAFKGSFIGNGEVNGGIDAGGIDDLGGGRRVELVKNDGFGRGKGIGDEGE